MSSKFQTKDWRNMQEWYSNGKRNECELFQMKEIQALVGSPIEKTNMRLNLLDFNLHNICNPLNSKFGLGYTENMDGKTETNGATLYFNLKMICSMGGAQTRSIREVSHFIFAQHQFIKKNLNSKIYFANILDGDCSYKFVYGNYENGKASLRDIQTLEEFQCCLGRIYIGDLYNFKSWFDGLQLGENVIENSKCEVE
jgi:hypothetical protein